MDSDPKILQGKTVRDEWGDHDENGDPWEDERLRRSRYSKDLLKKNPDKPRNKARASSDDQVSPSSSPASRRPQARLHGKRGAAEAHLDPDAQQALANKKRRRSPATPLDDLSYEPSQDVPSQLPPRVQPVRMASPTKRKAKNTNRCIVSDDESDSVESLSRRGSAPAANSSSRRNKRASASRSGSASRGASSAPSTSDRGSCQPHYPKATAKHSTNRESEQPKRRIKVGPPGPDAKRSPMKVGPPVGKPRAIPPKASHKVGPPVGKRKNVSLAGPAGAQFREGRNGSMAKGQTKVPAPTLSDHDDNNGDEDMDEDSLYPFQAPLHRDKPRPTPRFKPRVLAAAPTKDSSPHSAEVGVLSDPRAHTIRSTAESETVRNSNEGNVAARPPSKPSAVKPPPCAEQSRAHDNSDDISAFTATQHPQPTAPSLIASGSLQILQPSSQVTSTEHAKTGPRLSGPIPMLTPSTFRNYRMPGSDDEIDEIDEIEDYHSDSALPTGGSSREPISSSVNMPQDRTEGEAPLLINGETPENREIGMDQPDPTPYSPKRIKVDSPPPSTADADISRLQLQFPSSEETPSQANDTSGISTGKGAEHSGAEFQQSQSVGNSSAEAVDKPIAPGESKPDSGPAYVASPSQFQSRIPSRLRDDSGLVPETQESAPSTDHVSLEPYVPQSSQLDPPQPNTKNYLESDVLSPGSALSLPPARQQARTLPFGSPPDLPANVSGTNTDELSSTQPDPAIIIEIALLRRQLWGAEKALKSKDEELFNKDQELLHIKIEGARREREAEAMGRKDESNKYKGLLNEQKEMYDRVIRDLKDRGVVKKKPLAAADGRGDEPSPESSEHVALRAAVAQLCTFLSALTEQVSSIQEHASGAIKRLSSINDPMTPATEAPLPNASQSEVLRGLAALTSTSSTLRELQMATIASKAETVLSHSISLVKRLQDRATESAAAYDALVRAHDITNADVEYLRAKFQEVGSRAAELGEENRTLASQNEIAMSTTRDGVKQAKLYFGGMMAALERKLAQTEASAKLLAQRCERIAAKAHLVPVYKAEAERLSADLELEGDDIEFPMVIDATLGKFRHLQWRWQEDFASVGRLLGIDAEEFNHVEDFAATLAEKVEELVCCSWTELDELSQIGINSEDVDDLQSLVSEIVYRFKSMQDMIQKLRSGHRLDTPNPNDDKPLQDTSLPPRDHPTSNVVGQYVDIGDDYHYPSPLDTIREHTAAAAEAGESKTTVGHSSPAAPIAASEGVSSTDEHKGKVLTSETSSTGSEDSDGETYPCPSRNRDSRPCPMIFKAFPDVKQHVLAEHIYPDAAM